METIVKNQNDIIEFEGKKYKLLDDPQVDNYETEGSIGYYAIATDDNGHRYRVTWHTLADWDGDRDDDNACDWDNPDSVEIA